MRALPLRRASARFSTTTSAATSAYPHHPTTTPPPATPVVSVGFSNVGNGDIYRNFPLLLGSISETNAAPDSQLSVLVSVQRQSDGKYFDGVAWSAAPAAFPATMRQRHLALNGWHPARRREWASGGRWPVSPDGGGQR